MKHLRSLSLAAFYTLSAVSVFVTPASADTAVSDTAAVSVREYIVVFNESIDAENVLSSWAELPALEGLVVREKFESIFVGVSVEATGTQLEIIRADPRVVNVDVSQPVVSFANPVNTQRSASWGVDDVDGTRDGRFVYPTNPGKGVPIYVVDTPLMITHTEFAGRARHISAPQGTCSFDEWDGLFHGTAVASVAAGRTLGVARQANIISSGGLDCLASGSTSSLLRAFENIYTMHPDGTPGVVNMSLGMSCGFWSPSRDCGALEESLAKLKSKGLFLVAAAGNSDLPITCNIYPGGSPSVFTVGATDSTGGRAHFSNWGECIDIFAPGANIPTATSSGTTDTMELSGTSFSSPLVAGVAATILGANPTLTPDQVGAAIVAMARRDAIPGLDAASPNLLLRLDPQQWSRGYQIGKAPHATVSPTSCGLADEASVPPYARQSACWAKQKNVITRASLNANSNLTRVEAVTLMWRAAGSPTAATSCAFDDMDMIPTWGRQAACWAKEKGITTPTRFAAEQIITRSQMVTMLERAGYRQTNVWYNGPFLGFLDATAIPSWAKASANWAYVDRIVTNATFRGYDPVSRAEGITMLWRANASP